MLYDEVFSLRVTDTNNSLSDAQKIHSIDASPFTYYLILHVWRLVFGADFYTAQFFNIIMFLIAAGGCWRVWPKNRMYELLLFLGLNLSCSTTLSYLLEIRSYGLMAAIVMAIAACLRRLVDQTENPETEHPQKGLYLSVIILAGLISILHAWGSFLGAGILFALFAFDLVYGNRAFGLKAFLTSGVVISGLFILAYYSIFTVLSSRLSAGSVGFEDQLIDTPLVLFNGVWNLLYVTFRSSVFGAVTLLTILYLCVIRFPLIQKSFLVYVTPILFVFIIVFLIHAIFGRFIFKDYFFVILFPFIFAFISSVTFAIESDTAKVILIAGIALANFGSIPIFERFTEQPYMLKIEDNKSFYVKISP